MIDNKILKKIESQAGVYLFKKRDCPIYIGKAKNLKARLAAHLKNASLDSKEALIIKSADSVETIVTRSEFDALLLEAKLIKEHKPKYNVVWKDDKSYLYIKIARRSKYPKIIPVRKEDDGKSLYFGPFKSARVVYELIRQLRKVIPFCTQKRISTKSCFYSKIGLCHPCPNYIEKIKSKSPHQADKLTKDYRSNIKKVIRVLKRESARVFVSFEKKMQQEIEKENFEEALKPRDKIIGLQELINRRSFSKDENSYFPNISQLRAELSHFLSKSFPAASLSDRVRFECFDISTLFGNQAVGSMVVFENFVPKKTDYKRFKIKTANPSSDLDMLKEVITRRLKRREWSLPDVLIVDGGKPQVSTVKKQLDQFGLSLPLFGIAKEPDRIVMGIDHRPQAKLKKDSPLFNVIRHIRDESHRFARKYHLFLRRKKMML